MIKKEFEDDLDDNWVVSERGFYERYKPLRNKLRKYSPESILEACIEKMNKFDQGSVEGLLAMPWLWIVALKWAFIDVGTSFGSSKKITSKELEGLNLLLVKISNYALLPTQYKPMELYTRAITYQQAPYQVLIAAYGLARQDLMFGKCQENEFFKADFHGLHGLPLEVFLRLSGILVSMLEVNNKLKFSMLDLPLQLFEKEHVVRYLESISINIEVLGEKLSEASPGPRRPKEFFEQTPFMSFPLVKVGDIYWCVNRKVLMQALNYFVYDTLREKSKFSDKFGKRFEGYVGSIILGSGLNHRVESDLKKALGSDSKVVDFLVTSEGANFFIDAKGVDLAARAKLTHLSDVLKGAVKSSLLKAIVQGQDTNLRLTEFECSDPVIKPRKENYLFAVTYKPLFIGNGEFLNHLLGGEEVERILGDYPLSSQIPLSNIYFFSIDEFEWLMHLVKENKISLVNAIERAKLADSEFETAKYYFSAHLSQWPEYHEVNPPLEGQVSAMTAEFTG